MCVNTVIEHRYVRDRGIPESHTTGEAEERTVVKRHIMAEESRFNLVLRLGSVT